MANSRSARKRIRSNETKRIRNRTVRSAVRTRVSKARRALLGAGEETVAVQEFHEAIRALDRAAEKGIIHENNARRRKSRLARMAAHLAQAAGGDEAAARSAATGGAKGRGRKPATTRKAAAKTTAAKPAAKTAATRTTAKSTRPAPAPRGDAS